MAATPRRRTREEHARYLHESVKLHLWFLWTWLRQRPEESFVAALRGRVDVYRKTDVNEGFANHKQRRFDDPRWARLEQGLAEVYARTRDDASAERFEAEGFELARPRVDARLSRDFEEPPEALAFAYRCGSLDYDPPAAAHPRRVFVHIANALQPASFFDDPRYLADCFAALMAQCRRQFGAEEMETETWLNSHPRWLAFFPQTWARNMGPELRDVNAGFGYWGQFMTARGTFHDKNAAHLRATGQMPFWPRHSWCSFRDMEAHLRRFY
ncbi:MAG TPA: hypothetical protein P5137_03945 [Candidatus Brocadiia bacterium]|nr:hypothetical protein [Candidatus Brocadiia bacterium]